MPVTVTTTSSPLPTPIALLFTIVGAAFIALGFTVVPPIPDFGSSNIVLSVIAALLVIPAWVIFTLVMAKRILRRRDDVAEDVPDELEEPPSTHDPAVVATLIGGGRPGVRAIAGTTLALAARRALSIDEHGDTIVVKIRADAAGKNDCENLVLGGLRQQAEPDGDVVGPPIWKERVPWWPEFRRDARARAAASGLVESRIPFVGLMIVLVFTATGFSLLFFERIPVFVGSIVFANGAPHLVARSSGIRLTDAGKHLQAAWRAFGRYLHHHGSFQAAGPAGVVVWGPHLVYGVVLGVAEHAAGPLTPRVSGTAEEPPTEITKVYEL